MAARELPCALQIPRIIFRKEGHVSQTVRLQHPTQLTTWITIRVWAGTLVLRSIPIRDFES